MYCSVDKVGLKLAIIFPYSEAVNLIGFEVLKTSPVQESNENPLSGTALQVASIFVGIVVVFWLRKFNKLIQITNKAIENADVGDKTESIIKLENLRRDVFNTYRRGSLTDFQFDFLDKRLINYINKISNL